MLQATPQQLREWQQADATLRTVRELADSQKQAEGEAKFCYQKCTDSGLLMAMTTMSRPVGNLLPQQCRSAVLQITHDVPAAGHLGINKTRSRVLCRYYWPGEWITKEIVKLFSRVGIPDEILTDQGTNFMSALLQEIYRLLHIQRIRTSPYHPQTDGLDSGGEVQWHSKPCSGS